MARPKKTGLDYFPLDCILDTKTEMLQVEHGNDGFAVWIKILQEIYQTSDGLLDISLVIRRKTLAKRANIAEELWNNIVDTCVSIGLFEKEPYETGKILTSAGIRKRLLKVSKEREKALSRQTGKVSELPDSYSPNNPRITPESKVKESNKEKDKKEKPTKNLSELCEPFRQKYGDKMLNDFLDYWKEKTPGAKKERWEQQDFFDPARRLATWSSRQRPGNNNSTTTGPTGYTRPPNWTPPAQ